MDQKNPRQQFFKKDLQKFQLLNNIFFIDQRIKVSRIIKGSKNPIFKNYKRIKESNFQDL